MEAINPEQIRQWKVEHGDVFEVEVDGRRAYLKKPDRKTLSYAMAQAQTNPLGFAEVILRNCWLAGDESIQTDDSLFLAVSSKLDELIQIKEAELKKH